MLLGPRALRTKNIHCVLGTRNIHSNYSVALLDTLYIVLLGY